MSISTFNITPTTIITNHNNEQHMDIILNSNETTNVNDGRQNQRDIVKGERENREDNVKRRERTRHTNKNTDSVTSYTNEQYNCPIVNDSMANHISSNLNSNINYQNTSLSNNRQFHDYKPSHRSHTSSYRKTHYLDDSDEEIIKEEILEIINFNHYPTLIERWGDDTKSIIKQQGEFEIEIYVEFEEIEPTIIEEISYEIMYSNDQIQSTREIHHSYSESRNFRKIKKRRTKRKRTTSSINEILPSIINSTQSRNIDLIDEDISLQKREEINQYHVSWNDIISRIDESSINDNHIKTSEKETKLQVNQDETIQIPTQSTVNKDELIPSLIDEKKIDQDLQSFLNSLLSHLISEQSSSDANSISQTQIKNEQQESPVESSKPIIKYEEITPSIDHQSPALFESTKTIDEQVSSDSLIELVRQIRAMSRITHLPSMNNQTDITHTVQHTCEDKRPSDSNIISITTESVQKPFHDNEEITVLSDESPAMLINIHLPSTKIKTETRYTEKQADEKSITNLADEIEKQSEAISIQLKTTIMPKEELSQQIYDNKNESIPTNSVIETAETSISGEQQPLFPPKTEEDENVELLSDFLADIIRQIITTTSNTHLPSVNHTKQVIEYSTKDPSTEITKPTSIKSIPTTNIQDNELLKSSGIISTTKSVQETESIPTSKQSITYINESISPVTDLNAQINTKSSIQNSELLHLAEQNSISDTYDNFQQTIEINPINQTTTESSYSTSELTNIMNSILNLPMKPLSEEFKNIPQQSKTTEPISSSNFFIPEISTSSETDFKDLYQHRYFPFTTIEQTLSNFTLADNEQLDEKKITSDLTKIYYELQEQRHIQPVFDEIKTKEKQETSDVNVNNHIEHFDIKSFSCISNMPSKEYRQVFGVSDDIVNTLQSIVSNEKSQIIETSEDHQMIVSTDQEELVNNAISNVELDFRYTSLFDRINTLIKPLLDLPSSLFINENELISSNIKEDKDASTEIDYAASLIADVVSNIATNEEITIYNDTNASNGKDVQSQVSTTTDQITSIDESIKPDDEVLTPTVTDNEVTVSKSSEEIATKSGDDNQQQPSSIFPSKISTEPGSESIQSVIKTQQQEDTVETFVNDIDLSTAGTNQQQEYSAEDQKIEVFEMPLQLSTTNDEEHHCVFNLVINAISDAKETILNLDSSNEKFPSNIPEKSIDDTQQSEVSDNNKEQQTATKTVEEMINNTYEKIVSTQEQVIQSSKKPTIYNYPWYSSQYKVAVTEFDHPSITHQSLFIDHKQQDEFKKKPPSQELQVINDDYPWYSSYYTIVDADAKFARLYKQLNLFSEQSSFPTKVEIQNELQDEQDKDEEGIHLVQRRKRILSSTTHEKIVSTIIITTKSTLNPDIDLQPVILHGHPDVLIPVSPIVPQTTNTISKKKHKKKKKDNKETILFNVPEPTSSDVNKQKIDTTQSETEEERQKNIEMNDSVFIDQILNHELEPLHITPTIIADDQEPEILSTSIISNTDELKQIDDKTNESTSSDTSQLLPIPVTTLPENVKVNAQLIEQQQPILQSSLSTTKTIRTKVIVSPQNEEEEEDEEDNEGFQLVRYRKRILSATKSDQTPPSTSISKEILNPDIDQKIPIIFGHQSLPTSATADTQNSTAKKRRNKHKNHKKEIDSSSSINLIKAEQETTLQAHLPSSTIIENSNVNSNSTLSPTIKTTTIHKKPSASSEQEEDDNEGFQVVIYRKRITSASKFVNTPPSSLAKTKYKQNISRTIDHKPVVLHGRHGSASPSISRTAIITKTPSNQNKQGKLKEDKKQTSLFSTQLRSVSAETHIIIPNGAYNSSRISEDIKQKPEQQLKDRKHEIILDEKSMLDQSISNEQSTKHIVKEHHVSPKTEVNTADQQPSMEKIVLLTALNDSNTDTEKSTLIKDDNDGFQVAHHHKHISSSTTASEIVIPQTTTPKKKSKLTKDNASLSLTIDIDFIPLSIEETIDRKANDNIQQVPESRITSTNTSSNSNGATLINTTYETTTSEITEPVYQTDDTQSSLYSIKSVTSSTTAIEEISLPSNELPGQVDDLSIAQPVVFTNISQVSSTDVLPTTNQIENEEITKETLLTINIEDEHFKTTSNKKVTKRRKKKSHTQENVSISSIPNNIESNDIKKESNYNTMENLKPTVSQEINNKLDLFLPEYIRQQINTSIPIHSIITSSDNIEKKKQRPKMLQKDHEAKSLLTNEFDNMIDTEKQSIPYDDENINDDDEFIVQNFNSPEQTIDNILSRGFYLWLQESQAISQQSSSKNLTNIMQSIVIQPTIINNDDEDEDSWNVLKTIKPTYMIGVHPKKRIHITNSYLINHPECISTCSLLTTQSNKNKFQDISDNEEDTMNDTFKNSINTQLNLNNNTYQQTNFNLSSNFDDWAHFIEDKNSYHIGNDLSESLECFYTQTFDEDTLLSDEIPIQHSIKTEQQRYGDFLLSNNNESMIKSPLYKSKPSEYFQNWQKQESNSVLYQNDDEIFISHSTNGLSRQIKP